MICDYKTVVDLNIYKFGSFIDSTSPLIQFENIHNSIIDDTRYLEYLSPESSNIANYFDILTPLSSIKRNCFTSNDLITSSSELCWTILRSSNCVMLYKINERPAFDFYWSIYSIAERIYNVYNYYFSGVDFKGDAFISQLSEAYTSPLLNITYYKKYCSFTDLLDDLQWYEKEFEDNRNLDKDLFIKVMLLSLRDLQQERFMTQLVAHSTNLSGNSMKIIFQEYLWNHLLDILHIFNYICGIKDHHESESILTKQFNTKDEIVIQRCFVINNPTDLELEKASNIIIFAISGAYSRKLVFYIHHRLNSIYIPLDLLMDMSLENLSLELSWTYGETNSSMNLKVGEILKCLTSSR